MRNRANLLRLVATAQFLVLAPPAAGAAPELVADIAPGPASGLFSVEKSCFGRPLPADIPLFFPAPGPGFLYFSVDGGVFGAEPWRSDGTAGGTQMIAGIAAGPAGASTRRAAGGVSNLGLPCPSPPPRFLVAHGVVGDRIFIPSSNAELGRELWVKTGLDAAPLPIPALGGTGILALISVLLLTGIWILRGQDH